MPSFSSATGSHSEPMRRFYPNQEAPTQSRPPIQSAPAPSAESHSFQSVTQNNQTTIPPQPLPESQAQQGHSRQKRGDAAYLAHRHPILLQRLYNATDALLDTYPDREFIYDAYPDYLSLHLMRDRILRENSDLTEAFLREGCPIAWLNLLTDTVVSDLLCRRRCPYRNPMGDANTTSVRSVSRS